MFVESPTWTELQSVRLTSSTVESGLLSGCSVYTAAPSFSDDVTPMTSPQRVPQASDLTSDVTPVQGVAQLTSTLGVPCTVGVHRSWDGMAQQFELATVPVSSTYRAMLDDNPLLFAAGVVARRDQLSSTPSAPVGARMTSPVWPPSPPDSVSASPGVEFTVSAPPPPYTARPRAATGSPPPPYTDGSSPLEPLLTPVTRLPRKTHPGCTTIKYNLKNTPPDIEQRRKHFCDWPGEPRPPPHC